CIPRTHMLGVIPRVVKYPRGFCAGERAKDSYADLIHEPIKWSPRGCCVIFAISKLIFMCDCIYLWIELVDIGSHSGCFLLDAGINLRDERDGWIHRNGVKAYFRQKIGDGFDTKIDP